MLGFLKTTRSFPKIPEEVRSFPKKSEVFRRRPKSAEGEVIEKTLIHKIRDREKGIVIYSLTRGFRSLHGSEVTYFWKLCQARRQQLTFFKLVELVETFLIVVVSQNVFSAEIDNLFFYKVFQLAPGGGGFAKKFCPGGWWNSP